MSAHPFDRPLDRLLELLRESGLPYRCRPQVDRWTARCPLCLEHRLDITEHGFGRRVSVRCAYGCDPEAILHRLKHPDRCFSCGSRYGQAAELGRLVEELRGVAREQQQVLNALVADEAIAA